jgi:hypothetical protein
MSVEQNGINRVELVFKMKFKITSLVAAIGFIQFNSNLSVENETALLILTNLVNMEQFQFPKISNSHVLFFSKTMFAKSMPSSDVPYINL